MGPKDEFSWKIDITPFLPRFVSFLYEVSTFLSLPSNPSDFVDLIHPFLWLLHPRSVSKDNSRTDLWFHTHISQLSGTRVLPHSIQIQKYSVSSLWSTSFHKTPTESSQYGIIIKTWVVSFSTTSVWDCLEFLFKAFPTPPGVHGITPWFCFLSVKFSSILGLWVISL